MMFERIKTPPAWFHVYDDPKANAANWQATLLVLGCVIMPTILVIVIGSIIS